MTVKELIEELRTMPKNAHVYIFQSESGEAILAKQVEHSDTMSAPDEDDSSMSDGVVISGLN